METALNNGGNRGAWHLFAGLFITAIGVVFSLSNLGIWDFRYLFRYVWPLMLIVIGIRQIMRGRVER
jgi:uncharacterized integral membrane protein